MLIVPEAEIQFNTISVVLLNQMGIYDEQHSNTQCINKACHVELDTTEEAQNGQWPWHEG